MKIITILIFILSGIKLFSQSPAWTSIKANYQPYIAIPNEYITVYILPVTNGVGKMD